MKIKDIVNRDLVNLTNCEQEPIHIPGSIQPHGFLLAFSANGFVIEYCSGNIGELTGITYQQCLKRSFAEVFGADAEQKLRDHMGAATNYINPPFRLVITGGSWLCSLYRTGELFVAEFEAVTEDALDVSTVLNQTLHFVGDMERSETLKELCQRVAEQTRLITGYDRVMVYRFDKDYNGEVFAESKVAHIEPFLGLHYPHTDIPAQARQLYLTNLMRMIVDINYVPVPIYTVDDVPGKTLDMSRSYLRSVSPIHVEYLGNMGVGGTLTISLIHEGKLWGLITCHHYAPKYVPLYNRIAAQMQGHFLTSQIKVREVNEEYAGAAAINAALERLLDTHYDPVIGSLDKIVADSNLLQLAGASGVAILFEGILYLGGITPTEEQVRSLAVWCLQHAGKGKFVTSRLADVYEPAKEFASSGAGIIYHALSGLHDDAAIWFAPETNEEVHWAGDPGNAVLKTAKGLTPRNSFRLWKQQVQHQSREWSAPAQVAVETFVHTLQKHITWVLISEEEKRHRLLSEQLKEVNAELENINWISSHDLKEPLRKIQIFSSKILDKDQDNLSESTIAALAKVTRSANKMQQFITDLTLYNRVRQANSKPELIDLDVLLASIKEDLRENIADKNASLILEKLPSITGIPFLIRQLFTNLVLNSLKFVREGVAPQIHITAETGDAPDAGLKMGRYHKICIADNGIGFDNAQGEAIFKVFTRLHSQHEFEGSGVGLALCRKIMQNHHGAITATGTPGQGAVFCLYFPEGNSVTIS